MKRFAVTCGAVGLAFGALLSSPSLRADDGLPSDSSADLAGGFRDVASGRGLIVRVPINAKGEENASAAEVRVDHVTRANPAAATLPAVFERSTSLPAAVFDINADSSTQRANGRWDDPNVPPQPGMPNGPVGGPNGNGGAVGGPNGNGGPVGGPNGNGGPVGGPNGNGGPVGGPNGNGGTVGGPQGNGGPVGGPNGNNGYGPNGNGGANGNGVTVAVPNGNGGYYGLGSWYGPWNGWSRYYGWYPYGFYGSMNYGFNWGNRPWYFVRPYPYNDYHYGYRYYYYPRCWC